MKADEFEACLKEHAKRVKAEMTVSSHIKAEKYTMIDKSFKLKRVVLIAAAIICLAGTTALAAHHLLSIREIALHAGYEELAEIFETEGTALNLPPQKSGDYTISLMGITSGKNLTGFVDVEEDRTFIVGSISRTDGEKLAEYSGIQMSPLIGGYEPWRVNIFTLKGGKSEFISDDDMVNYFVYECDALEMFADRTVYMAFYEGIAPSAEIFTLNEDGSIDFNTEYTGVKALFEIPMDVTKADPEKAERIVAEMWD